MNQSSWPLNPTPFLVVICTAFLLGSSAHAGKFQIGASVGEATLDAGVSGARVDMDDTGFRVSAAYRLFQFVAIEAGYTDLGEFDETVDGTRFMAKADLISAFAVGILPVSPRLELFGKVGAAMWDVSGSADDGSKPVSDNGTDLAYGVGVSYKFIERLSIRVEWETNDTADNEIKFISAGLQFHF